MNNNNNNNNNKLYIPRKFAKKKSGRFRRKGRRSHAKVAFTTFLAIFVLTGKLNALRWLAIRDEKTLSWNNGKGCQKLRTDFGLTGQQAKLCRRAWQAMPHVQQAAQLALKTCLHLFRFRRWNCSSLERTPHLLLDLTLGTRERSFVQALSSAALTYAIARGCAESSIDKCGCADHPEEEDEVAADGGDFQWGGCGDDVRWAAQFARQYTESEDVEDSLAERNAKIGRKMVLSSVHTRCKCHGVSGSCSVKTCWRALPLKFEEIAVKLMRAYHSARLVHQAQIPSGLHGMDEKRLLYVKKSVDYCDANEEAGSFGTKGRECHTNNTSVGHCDKLCCRRGYEQKSVMVTERCHCQYHWCCYVQCKTCHILKEIKICK